MVDDIRNLIPQGPTPDWGRFDEPERGKLIQLFNHVQNLGAEVKRFHSAVQLFEYSVEKTNVEADPDFRPGKMGETYDKWKPTLEFYGPWKLIAAREGALTLWTFARVMQFATAELRRCKFLHETVRISDAEAILAEYRKRFPDAENLRDAFAHLGELAKTQGTRRDNSISGPFETPSIAADENSKEILISCGIHNNTVYTTAYGKRLSYEISTATTRALIELQSAFYAVFDCAASSFPNFRTSFKE